MRPALVIFIVFACVVVTISGWSASKALYNAFVDDEPLAPSRSTSALTSPPLSASKPRFKYIAEPLQALIDIAFDKSASRYRIKDMPPTFEKKHVGLVIRDAIESDATKKGITLDWRPCGDKPRCFTLNNEDAPHNDFEVWNWKSAPFYAGKCAVFCSVANKNYYKGAFATILRAQTGEPRQPPYDRNGKDLYMLGITRVHIPTVCHVDGNSCECSLKYMEHRSLSENNTERVFHARGPMELCNRRNFDWREAIELMEFGKMDVDECEVAFPAVDEHERVAWTYSVLFYMRETVREVVKHCKSFARQKGITKPIRIVQPTLRNGTIYELQEKDSGYANLYMTYHRLHNTNNHLHLHCWFNGEDDAFASTIAYQRKRFRDQYAIENKIEYDLGLGQWGQVMRPAPVAFEGWFKILAGVREEDMDKFTIDFGV